jgi:serine/threonine protein kinase
MSKRVVRSNTNEIPTSIKTCLTKHEYGKKIVKEMLPDANEIPSGSKYVIGEQIGEGAQGAVFVGYQISECGIRKKVAIKVLKKNYGEKEIKRLVKEAKILELLTPG